MRCIERVLLATGLLGLAAASGAEKPGPKGPEPDLSPGRETRVDNDKVGEGYFTVYVPSDYKADRRWPVIFCYHGQGGKPTVWPFKDVTGGKGFIVVGLGYIENTPKSMTMPELDRLIAQEFQVVGTVAAYLERRLKVERDQFFVGGFSAGGWMASSVGEASPSTWAGIAILGAGRQKFELPLKNPASLRNKPLYVGVGDKDPNFEAAKIGVAFYKKVGARVTFEEYPGLGHTMKMDTKVLPEWLLSNGPQRRLKPRLAAARAAEQAGKLGKAYALYSDLAPVSETDESCVAAAAAAKALAEKAEAKLAEADKAIAEKRYDEASRLLVLVASRFDGSTFGERADAAIKKLQSDPEVQKALQAEKPEPKPEKPVRPESSAERAERECQAWLNLAENYLRAKKPEKAKEYLDKIIDKYGDTDWGAKARKRLGEMD
jgi:predicted esterase